MKKPNNTSWEALDKAWQKQIREKEVDIPAGMWEQLENRLNKKPIKPLWIRINIWTWSAAAVLAIIIGLNWESAPLSETKKNAKITIPELIQAQPVTRVKQKNPNMVLTSRPKQVIKKEVETIYSPALEQNMQLEAPMALSKVEEKSEQTEEIWVSVDINPINESTKPLLVAETINVPVKKNKRILVQLIKQVKQVIEGERLDWQALKERNRPLEDGIHQVANTYYRTEQTVKQAFQIQ